jgi:hypothetical protein
MATTGYCLKTNAIFTLCDITFLSNGTQRLAGSKVGHHQICLRLMRNNVQFLSTADLILTEAMKAVHGIDSEGNNVAAPPQLLFHAAPLLTALLQLFSLSCPFLLQPMELCRYLTPGLFQALQLALHIRLLQSQAIICCNIFRV